jgi:hypothetical protein
MRPSLALEHLEHRHLVRAEWVTLDLLQPHGRKPALARLRDIWDRETNRISHDLFYHKLHRKARARRTPNGRATRPNRIRALT